MSNDNSGANQFLTAQPSTFAPVQTVYADTQENRAALADKPAEVAPEGTTTETPAESTPAAEGEKPKEPSVSKKMAELAKAERRMAKAKAEAESIIERSKTVQEAFNEPDLIVALQKLGLDPNEVYQKMTKQALDKLNNKPKDPVQAAKDKEIEELKEYAAQSKQRLDAMQYQQEQEAHQKALQTHVVPLITGNPDKYEALIATFGSQEEACKNVYAKMVEEYQKSGTVIKPEEAADAMENFFTDAYNTSLEAASKLKKFQNRFQSIPQSVNKPASTLTEAEQFSNLLAAKLDKTPSASDKPPTKTLTNNMSPTPQGTSAKKVDHLAQFLKNKGL